MARVLIVTSGIAGRVKASSELTRRLRAAGHEAVIGSPAEIDDHLVVGGFTYHRLPGEGTAIAEIRESKPRGIARAISLIGRLPSLRTRSRRRESKVDDLDPEGLARAMADLEPDLILVDMELPVHVMTGHASGVPTVTWTTMLSVWKRPGLPPLGSQVTPGVGWSGSSLGIELEWLRFRLWKWLRNQRLRITRVGEDQISVLRCVAERVGFPFEEETDLYQWVIPFVYRTIPTLVFNAEGLEFPHPIHPLARYVGPVLRSQPSRTNSREEQDVSDHLDILYRNRRSGGIEALVYCSFGAWHKGDDSTFLRKIIAAFAPHPEWHLIVGLGGRVELEALGDIPSNVHLFSWAPQMEVLAECDLAIHHAGISSVNESVVAGVPMLVYPFEFLDQPGNAARVAFHGMGIVGSREHDTPEIMRRHIGRLISDGRYKASVASMRGEFSLHTARQDPLAAIRQLLGE